jgi:hypothetical protein
MSDSPIIEAIAAEEREAIIRDLLDMHLYGSEKMQRLQRLTIEECIRVIRERGEQ